MILPFGQQRPRPSTDKLPHHDVHRSIVILMDGSEDRMADGVTCLYRRHSTYAAFEISPTILSGFIQGNRSFSDKSSNERVCDAHDVGRYSDPEIAMCSL